MFQGQSYAAAAAAQIFILLGPLLFLFFCQHFRKSTLQAQVTRLGGSSCPFVALKYQSYCQIEISIDFPSELISFSN